MCLPIFDVGINYHDSLRSVIVFSCYYSDKEIWFHGFSLGLSCFIGLHAIGRRASADGISANF